MTDLILRSRRAVTPEGVRPADVVVREGRIVRIAPYGSVPGAEDLGAHALLPGLVDSHVHVNEPGHTDWEGFATATRAAAAGGITAIVDMPLNSLPVTTTRAAFELKLAAAEGQTFVDVAFWGGVVPADVPALDDLLRAGVAGCKAFLIDSGLPEFAAAGEADLRAAMPVLARHRAPLLVHAELALPVGAPAPDADPRSYATFLASRPRAFENAAVELMIRLARETGCAVHIVHLSSCEALGPLEQARREGLPITVETCPHYLTFTAGEVPDGATEHKCCPPIRERENREALWDGLRRGVIDMVVSDHSPCPPAMKRRGEGFEAAWGGISSVQLLLPAVWTEASRRGFGLEALARWLAREPARLAGLTGKGRLEEGCAADLVVWDPEAEAPVAARGLFHRHALTPYEGRTLRGRVLRTYLAGALIFEDDRHLGAPRGRLWRHARG